MYSPVLKRQQRSMFYAGLLVNMKEFTHVSVFCGLDDSQGARRQMIVGVIA